MNKNIIIVLSGALAVALVVALLVQVSLGGKKQEAVKEAKVEILVAEKDLALGQPLKEGDTRWQEWPQAGVFPGAVVRKEKMEPAKALEGRLARNITKGEPILSNAILGEAKGNFVAASLEPGMRAVAIEIKAASSVGGFIGPGDRVDVVLTYKITFDAGDDDDPRVKEMVQRNIKKMASETILQNLKVLAVDQIGGRRQIGGVAQPYDQHFECGERLRRVLHFADTFQQHLPGARKNRHGQRLRAEAARGRGPGVRHAKPNQPRSADPALPRKLHQEVQQEAGLHAAEQL